MYGPHPFVCGVQRYGAFPYTQMVSRFILTCIRNALETRTIIFNPKTKNRPRGKPGNNKQRKSKMVCHSHALLRIDWTGWGQVRDRTGPNSTVLRLSCGFSATKWLFSRRKAAELSENGKRRPQQGIREIPRKA
jgi:hypothetical protein